MANLSKITIDIKEAAKENVENMTNAQKNGTVHTSERNTYNSPEHETEKLSDQENKDLNAEENNDDFLNNGKNGDDMNSIEENEQNYSDDDLDDDLIDDEIPQNDEHFLNSADPNDPLGDGSNRNENY